MSLRRRRRCCTDVDLAVPRALDHRRARRLGQRQDHAAAGHRRIRAAAGRARCGWRGQVIDGPGRHVPPERRRLGYVAQEGALFPHLTVAGNVGFGLRRRAARPGPGGRSCSSWSACAGSAGATRTSCPAASSSGWRWPAPWPSTRRWCCSTSRSRRWTPRCAPACGPTSPACCATTGTSVVLVTHDQQEALSMADQVAVLRDGRVAQVGSPRRSTPTRSIPGWPRSSARPTWSTPRFAGRPRHGARPAHRDHDDPGRAGVLVRPEQIATWRLVFRRPGP